MRILHPLLLGLLLVALAPSAPARGDDDAEPAMEPRHLALGQATVLASPGTPDALGAWLPGGGARPPRPLAWPLPAGPVVVLGLPGEDDVAQQVADALEIATDDLDGGYRIAAWQDGDRPVVVVMAADAAALAAARFEFDPSAPVEMMAPDMRSLDFKRPNQEAGVAVLAGTRLARPRHRVRAWLPSPGGLFPAALDEDAVSAGAGARLNRIWIDHRTLTRDDAGTLLERARAHGIEPVLVLPMGDATVDRGVHAGMDLGRMLAFATEAMRTHRIRRVALVFEQVEGPFPRRAEARGVCEAMVAAAVARSLRPALAELVVVPCAHDDARVHTLGLPPDLRGIPEATLAWSGPSADAPHITRAQAEARVREAGVPVVLLDTWAAPFQDPARPYVPSLPGGRDADLHEVLDGVVVVGRRGTEALLESLWEPVGSNRLGRGLLEGLVPTDRDERPADWLARFDEALQAEARESLGLIPWLDPVAATLASTRARTPPAALHVAPWHDATLVLDGRPDEPAWQRCREAGGMLVARDGIEVMPLPLEHALAFAVRIDVERLLHHAVLLRIVIGEPGRPRALRAELGPEGWLVEGGLGASNAGVRHAGVHQETGGLTTELLLDRVALGGDPHPGRVFTLGLAWGPAPLWPADTAGIGRLVVGPRVAGEGMAAGTR